MKKSICLLSLIITMIMVTGCSSSHTQSETSTTNLDNNTVESENTNVIDENSDTTEAEDNQEQADALQNNSDVDKQNKMNIKIGENSYTATLVDNSSTQALKEILSRGSLSIKMSDYGSMEKVGNIGESLPSNDEQITTEAGDIILYQGNALVIYYDTNDWNFTRIGKIDDITQEELKKALGTGDVTVTLSLD